MNRLKKLSYLILIVLVSACKHHSIDWNQKANKVLGRRYPDILDSKFAFHDLKHGDIINNFFFEEGKMYTDTSHSRKLMELSDEEKLRFIYPYMRRGIPYPSYVINNMSAWFVAKQSKAGQVQPLIIYAGAKNDWSGVLIITLNKKNQYFSGYCISDEYMEHNNYV